jgi:uncharacterized membrane protein YedE/YeeE
MRFVLPLVCGLLFGAGLSISGMTDTRVVLGFLDVAGQWNPTLAFVMTGALIITLPAFQYLLKKRTPVLCEAYSLPKNTTIDLRLIIGAAIFGVGWGLYGYCPGPAVASLSSLNPEPWLFVAAMAVGLLKK